MSRFLPESNQWICRIVVFGPPTTAALQSIRQLTEALPATERKLLWDTPGKDATQVAIFVPATHTLGALRPIYSIHALRETTQTEVERQKVLYAADGVVLVIDPADPEASRFAERDLERFLGMYGKMIATMPVVVLSTTELDAATRATFHIGDEPLFVSAAHSPAALKALTAELEQDSGFAEDFGFDSDADVDDDDDSDEEDIEFDDLHAYDDDE